MDLIFIGLGTGEILILLFLIIGIPLIVYWIKNKPHKKTDIEELRKDLERRKELEDLKKELEINRKLDNLEKELERQKLEEIKKDLAELKEDK